jgi:molybdate transport system ATP-binding protein
MTNTTAQARIDIQLKLARANFSLDLTLALPARGVTALFGPSGCGKTTLLRALAGLERAAGRVVIAGEHEAEVWQDDTLSPQRFVPTHQRPLGYVIQDAALFPHLDVRHNLHYGLRRIAPAERRVALDDVVDLLGIGALMERRPATLSGGECQRVAIARALATSPRVLLMDEPLAALDAARKADILPYLERLHEALAIPVIYVSHALDEVARLADHLVLMDPGRHVGAAGPAAGAGRRRGRGARWHRERMRRTLATRALARARCHRRRRHAVQPVGPRPGLRTRHAGAPACAGA